MEEASENGKEMSHSAHANGMNESSGTSRLASYNYIRHVSLCRTAAVMQADENV